MIEPIYIYVKGQGWVAHAPFMEVTYKDGTRARLEAREPQVGEHYACGWGAPYLTSPKVANLKIWAEIQAKHYSVNTTSIADVHIITRYNELGKGLTGWVTIVPL
jgi:hypothetical protein